MSDEYSSKFQERMNELFSRAQDEDPKLTKSQYAAKIGATLNALRGWLRGSGQPDADGLARIADAESVSVDWLVGKTSSPSVKREERSLNRKMENLLSLVEDGAISDVIRERIKKLHIRLVQISERLIELQDIDKPKLDPARIYEAVKIWNDAEDEETVKAMFQTFVSDVRVFPDRVEVDLFLDVNGRKY